MNKLPAVQILSPQKVCPGGQPDPWGPSQFSSLFKVPHLDYVRAHFERRNFERKCVKQLYAQLRGVIKYSGLDRDGANKVVLN